GEALEHGLPVAPAEREIDLMSQRGGHHRDERHRPPRPVARRSERAADDHGRFSLQPRPDEQHRAAITVDYRAEIHASAQSTRSGRGQVWRAGQSSVWSWAAWSRSRRRAVWRAKFQLRQSSWSSRARWLSRPAATAHRAVASRWG